MATQEQPTFDARGFGARFASALLRALGVDRVVQRDGKKYRVGSERTFCVVPVVVATTSTTTAYTAVFEAPYDVLIENVTARNSDSAGLAGFRIGWLDNADEQGNFFKHNGQATDVTYPVASTMITDAGTPKAGQDPWDVVLKKNDKRTFRAYYVSGSAPFTAEITLHCRKLTRI